MICSHCISLTLCMLGNFSCFHCFRLTFFKINFFKKFFWEHYQSGKQFGPRSGLTFCHSRSWSKLFAKVISRQQKLLLARKELIKDSISLKTIRYVVIDVVLILHYYRVLLSFPCCKKKCIRKYCLLKPSSASLCLRQGLILAYK